MSQDYWNGENPFQRSPKLKKNNSSKDEVSLNYTISATSKPKRSLGGVDSDYTRNNSRPKDENLQIQISSKMQKKIAMLN